MRRGTGGYGFTERVAGHYVSPLDAVYTRIPYSAVLRASPRNWQAKPSKPAEPAPPHNQAICHLNGGATAVLKRFAQLHLDGLELGSHALLDRLAPDDKRAPLALSRR